MGLIENGYVKYTGPLNPSGTVLTGLNPEKKYDIKVVAVDKKGKVSRPASIQIDTSDKTAPGEVSGLVITPTDRKLVLTWIDPVDADFDHVEIWYGIGSANTKFLGTPLKGGTDIEGLLNGIDYTVLVKSFDGKGNESVGASLVSTPVDNVLPDQVTNLALVGGDGNIVVTWDANTNDDFDHYDVYYGIGSADTKFEGTIDNTGTILTGIEFDSVYIVAVTAVDVTHNSSPVTNDSITIVDTYAPDNVANVVAIVGNGQVTLAWDNPVDLDFDHCEVYYGIGSASIKFGGTVNNTGTAVTGLTNDTEYTFRVIPFDTTGNANMSAIDLTQTPTDSDAPNEVSNLVVTDAVESVILTWDNPDDADLDHVEVWYGVSGDVLFDGTVDPTGTILSGLTPGEEHIITIKTVDTSGNTSVGIGSTGTPKEPLPKATIRAVVSDTTTDEQIIGSLLNMTEFDRYIPGTDFKVLGITRLVNDDVTANAPYDILGSRFVEGYVNKSILTTDGDGLEDLSGLSLIDIEFEGELFVNKAYNIYSIDYVSSSIFYKFDDSYNSNGTFLNDKVALLAHRNNEYLFRTLTDAEALAIPGYGTIKHSYGGNVDTMSTYQIKDTWCVLNALGHELSLTNLTITPQDKNINISWDENIDPNFDHVEVWYGKDLSSPIPVSRVDTKFTDTISDTGLDITADNDTLYTIIIYLVDSNGYICCSYVVDVTPVDLIPTAPVTNLIATPGIHSTTLTWDNPSDADFDNIVIEYDLTAGGGEGQSVSDASSGIVINSLTAEPYTFNVYAYDVKGNQSVVASVETTPTIVPGLENVVVVPAGNTIAITWDDNADTSAYEVEVMFGPGELSMDKAGVVVGDQGCTLTGLNQVVDYDIRLRVKYPFEGMPDSVAYNETVQTLDTTPPNQVENVSVDTVELTSFVVRWEPPTLLAGPEHDYDHAEVAYKVAGSEDTPTSVVVDVDGVHAVVTGLSSDTIYDVSIVAVDVTGNQSLPATIQQATPDTIAPDDVTELVMSSTRDKEVNITWTNPVSPDFDGVDILITPTFGGGGEVVATVPTLGSESATITLDNNFDTYSVKVKSYDTSGNRSDGVTIDVKGDVPIDQYQDQEVVIATVADGFTETAFMTALLDDSGSGIFTPGSDFEAIGAEVVDSDYITSNPIYNNGISVTDNDDGYGDVIGININTSSPASGLDKLKFIKLTLRGEFTTETSVTSALSVGAAVGTGTLEQHLTDISISFSESRKYVLLITSDNIDQFVTHTPATYIVRSIGIEVPPVPMSTMLNNDDVITEAVPEETDTLTIIVTDVDGNETVVPVSNGATAAIDGDTVVMSLDVPEGIEVASEVASIDDGTIIEDVDVEPLEEVPPA